MPVHSYIHHASPTLWTVGCELIPLHPCKQLSRNTLRKLANLWLHAYSCIVNSDWGGTQPKFLQSVYLVTFYSVFLYGLCLSLAKLEGILCQASFMYTYHCTFSLKAFLSRIDTTHLALNLCLLNLMIFRHGSQAHALCYWLLRVMILAVTMGHCAWYNYHWVIGLSASLISGCLPQD